MKKSLSRVICMLSLLSLALCGCGAKGDVITESGMYKTNETRGIVIADLSTDMFLVSYSYEGTECVLPAEFTDGKPINWLSEGALYGDDQMQSLVIPDCYEGTSLYCLSGLPNLKTIWIGSGLSHFDDFTFWDCPGVESVTVSPENSYFYSAGNCIIERETDALKIGFTSSVVPEGVKKILTSAFMSVGPVHTIPLPATLTEIEPAAFFRSSIETVTIPPSVVRIGDMAFNECELQSVYIPASVTEMGEKIFFDGKDVTIYCEAESQPEGWDENWLAGCENPTVVWGYTPESSGSTGNPLLLGQTAGIEPETRETVLELVQTFAIGKDGVFLHSPQGAAITDHGEIGSLGTELFYADETGMLYILWGNTCIRLNDGMCVEIDALQLGTPSPFDICYASAGSFYWLTNEGKIARYDFSSGEAEASSFAVSNPMQVTFGVDAKGEVYAWCDGGRKTLRGSNPEAFSGGMPIVLRADEERVSYDGTHAVYKRVQWDPSVETVYYDYDKAGTLLSAFRYRQTEEEMLPCNVPAWNGSVLTSYLGHTVTVGNTTFEHCCDSRLFVSPDGGMYLAVLYPEKGEIYRITPGYDPSLVAGEDA